MSRNPVHTIGSRELKAHLSEVLRRVREHHEVYAVTHRGRTIARLVPESLAQAEAGDFESIWAEMDQLAAGIAQQWPDGESAAEAVSEGRRDL